MYQYVVFFNDETWVIITAEEYIFDNILHTIDFYKDHELIGTFDTTKIIGFCRYEYALMRILKGQKVCNGFEGVDENGK